MINRYDRGAQTLGDLDYAPFPDIARAIPELPPRLATRLATPSPSPEAAESETPVIPAASIVGAIGFEPEDPSSVLLNGSNMLEADATPNSESKRREDVEAPTLGATVANSRTGAPLVDVEALDLESIARLIQQLQDERARRA